MISKVNSLLDQRFIKSKVIIKEDLAPITKYDIDFMSKYENGSVMVEVSKDNEEYVFKVPVAIKLIADKTNKEYLPEVKVSKNVMKIGRVPMGAKLPDDIHNDILRMIKYNINQSLKTGKNNVFITFEESGRINFTTPKPTIR